LVLSEIVAIPETPYYVSQFVDRHRYYAQQISYKLEEEKDI